MIVVYTLIILAMSLAAGLAIALISQAAKGKFPTPKPEQYTPAYLGKYPQL